MESIAYLIYGLFLMAVSIVLLVLWVVTKKHIFGILLCLFWLWYLISDSKTYGSFWTDFHENEIVSIIEDSDFNKTIIGWQSQKENFFYKKELVDFAASNEWTLCDSLAGPIDSLRVFLDRFEQFNCAENELQFVIFRDKVLKHLGPDTYQIYFFSTNVQAIWIPTTGMTTKNGFAIFNANGKQLRVYHFWGEI